MNKSLKWNQTLWKTSNTSEFDGPEIGVLFLLKRWVKRITKEKCFHGPVLFQIEADARHDRPRPVIDPLNDWLEIATVKTQL